MNKSLFCLVLTCVCTAHTFAATASNETTNATIKQLATSPGWLALLSYRPDWIGDGYESQADSKSFFLSPNGKHDPLAELQASIDALQQPNTLADEHPRCRFPARYNWLARQLPAEEFPAPPNCSDFDTFALQLNAAGATMVFPAAYLNSPSSMFGHTLLRIDQHGQDDSNLILALTASYAAKNNPNDSGLSFVAKGLMGGYPGEVAVLPYYMKLKEYRDIESRDIWEYRLNLSQEETDQLVRHLWEVSGETFKYYFFTENCSYRLLGMLDVLRPQTPMLDDFHLHAIPVDTVRVALDHGYVSDTHFRPSAVSQFRYSLSQLSPSQQEAVYTLVQGEEANIKLLAPFPPSEQSAILDVAFQYSRLAQVPGQNAAERSLSLLKYRNQINATSHIPTYPTPTARDDQGHFSGRIQLESGRFDKQNYLAIHWRPAYHSLIDPGLGYPLGSELRFFDTSLRYYEDDGLSVEDLTLIGIKSLKARDRFFAPLSWSVAFGGKRVFEEDKRIWTPTVEGLLGPSWQVQGGLLYWLAGGEGRVSSKLDAGHDALAKMDIGYVRKSNSQQLRLGATAGKGLVSGNSELRLHAKHSVHLSDTLNGYWTLERRLDTERYITSFSLGLSYYF